MTSNHPDRKSKKGAALIMVMLSGMLIVIIGIGMLFFYQKQVERRMRLEFDIHRRLAAKSGFNLVQYEDVQDELKLTNGVAYYTYIVSTLEETINRPVILVNIKEPGPLYDEDDHGWNISSWEIPSILDADCDVILSSSGDDGYLFQAVSTNVGVRAELRFAFPFDAAWTKYPFGLCYDFKIYDSERFWAGYVFVAESNSWDSVFNENYTVMLATTREGAGENQHCLEIHAHHSNTNGSVFTDDPILSDDQVVGDMNVATELYISQSHVGWGTVSGSGFDYEGKDINSNYCLVSNVVLGIGGVTVASITNQNDSLVLSKFQIRNPYEYEIRLSWTNRNRYFGTTDITLTTNVLATVVDKTAVGNDYYFFDSFETVVP